MAVINWLIFFSLLAFCSSCRKAEKEYYENGSVKAEYFLNDGYLDGVKIEYFKNGKIRSEVEYKNGSKNGFKKMFFENGELKSISSYSNGKQSGELVIYYLSGEIEYRAFFENGQRVDTSFFYSEEGNLIELKVYGDGGEIAYLKKYDKQGELLLDSIVPIIDISSDSVQLGSIIKVEVDLTFNLEGPVQVEFGRVLGENLNADTTYFFSKEESKVKFEFAPVHLGLNEHYIKFKHEVWNDEPSVDGVMSEINVFVVGQGT